MADDPLKKYWQQRRQGAEQMPHYRPAHETQGIINARGLPDFGSPPNGPAPSRDRDVTQMLQQRLQQQMVQGQMGGGTSYSVADLQEGLPYYTSVENSFGGTKPLIRAAGIIKGPTSRNVQVKREVSGYLIDNMNVVDLAKLQEHPELMISLVEVSVPFLGSFLVPREAIMRRDGGPMGDGRQILKG